MISSLIISLVVSPALLGQTPKDPTKTPDTIQALIDQAVNLKVQTMMPTLREDVRKELVREIRDREEEKKQITVELNKQWEAKLQALQQKYEQLDKSWDTKFNQLQQQHDAADRKRRDDELKAKTDFLTAQHSQQLEILKSKDENQRKILDLEQKLAEKDREWARRIESSDRWVTILAPETAFRISAKMAGPGDSGGCIVDFGNGKTKHYLVGDIFRAGDTSYKIEAVTVNGVRLAIEQRLVIDSKGDSSAPRPAPGK